MYVPEWIRRQEAAKNEGPAVTNPGLYTVLCENGRVRVLEYRDQSGDRTMPHGHPGSDMVTLSSFRRRLPAVGRQVDVELPAGQVRWLDAQDHAGENAASAVQAAVVSSRSTRTVQALAIAD